jgi:hypothetical protein
MMLIRAFAIDTDAAIAASHKALFDMRGVESVCSLKPHFKQYAASSDTSVPHLWQYTAMPFIDSRLFRPAGIRRRNILLQGAVERLSWQRGG